MADVKNMFFLRVIAAEKVFYTGYARNLIIETLDGQISFLAHHQEMMAALNPGELQIQDEEGKWIRVIAGCGSMVFANNRATVLVETCERPEEIDRRRAEEALERAKERMRQKQSQREYYMTQAAMARALSRLSLKDKLRV